MADWNGLLNKSSGFGRRSVGDDEDFDEGDVWGLVEESDYLSPKRELFKESSSGSSSSTWRLPAAPRMIPRANTQYSHEAQVVQRSSAPLDVPDWSKIYGKNGKMGSENGEKNEVGCYGYGYGDYYYQHQDDGDDDDGDDMVPPHEWIARKFARSQISSFSVCEGIGRTLKGRDLSKVRNAILTKTGFIE